jgi:hypothetical protein
VISIPDDVVALTKLVDETRKGNSLLVSVKLARSHQPHSEERSADQVLDFVIPPSPSVIPPCALQALAAQYQDKPVKFVQAGVSPAPRGRRVTAALPSPLP